ncbi:HAMP domain-containing sensor histidine kinase [Gorillibacterium timonense]|uniref:HAMP domain-containing sensor histidine kinase n=1 Tax=Gorillibacterium timonense TaxID=1689269 RepID=UPI00071D6ECF|nr:HAMP domain-containing sensor histidine kinase [Gorillibacterium timonense]
MFRKLMLLLVVVALTGGVAVFGFLAQLKEETPLDRVAINAMVQQTEINWGIPETLERLEGPYAYTLLDQSGAVLFQSAEGLSRSVNEALLNRETPIDIMVNGQLVGKIIIHNDHEAAFHRLKMRLTLLSGAMMVLPFLLGLGYILYLNKNVLRPFSKMQRFARHIAKGDLDLPLEMDRNHLFGAFTESFDMMREELAVARQNEYLANKSKKELVAGLSHDIKTPVASIKAITELMLINVADEKTERQLQTLYSKADQIDQLVTDMFHSTLEELNELKVNITEESSELLNEIIRNADYSGVITAQPVPSCLLAVDAIRLQQVVDNVVHNARKYAGTGVAVSFLIREGFLEAEFADGGPGVEEEELPLLFHQYYRGSRAVNQSGAGLGLYLSRHLMRRMQGEIECYNRPDGFTVKLIIPLTGTN